MVQVSSVRVPDVYDKDVKVLIQGCNIGALSIILGTSCMTVRQYGTARRFLIYYIRHSSKMPTYSTILYSLYPAASRVLFAVHAYIQERINVTAAGVTPSIRSEAESGAVPMQNLLVILLSPWVCTDQLALLCSMKAESSRDGRYPEVCFFINSNLQKHRRWKNRFRMLHETRLEVGFYEYGDFINSGDIVEIQFSVPDNAFRAFLLQHQTVSALSSTLSLQPTIRGSRIHEEGRLGDGLGDITVYLQTEENFMREMSLKYRVTGLGGGCTSLLSLSATNFPSRNARLHSVSLLATSPERQKQAPPLGTLLDDRKYVRVPYLLFTDDVSSMGGHGGSCGGCYVAPVLSPTYGKRGMESVRVLGLTTPGVSSNSILRNIVEDVVRCSTDGVEVTEEGGDKVVLFAEIVGYIGDYPGMSHCLDVMGHNAAAPCPHCDRFRRADLQFEECNSRYGYKTSINSSEPSFKGTKRRMRIIWDSAGTDKEELNQVGLRALAKEQLESLPLHMLSDRLEAAQSQVPHRISCRLFKTCSIPINPV